MTAAADETAIRALFQRLQAAHAARDAARIMACYAANARLFDLGRPLGRRGQDRAALQAWLDSWDAPVRMLEQGSELDIDGDLAVSTGYLRFEASKGGEDQSLWFSATTVLRRGAEGWRIIHDHSSVPMAMDGSGRAETGLNPGDARHETAGASEQEDRQ